MDCINYDIYTGVCLLEIDVDEYLDIPPGTRRDYICDVCGKVYRSPSGLYKHKHVHESNKRFECTMCGKKFYQREHMEKHLNTHSVYRTHSCNVCNRKFRYTSSLSYHKRTSHI